jgi:hypothetical protein
VSCAQRRFVGSTGGFGGGGGGASDGGRFLACAARRQHLGSRARVSRRSHDYGIDSPHEDLRRTAKGREDKGKKKKVTIEFESPSGATEFECSIDGRATRPVRAPSELQTRRPHGPGAGGQRALQRRPDAREVEIPREEAVRSAPSGS